MRHIVSFSGEKDSTAMLLKMIEENWKIDEIIFCDTGMESPAMYQHIDKVEKYIGTKITQLKAENSFEYMMLYHKKQKGKYKGKYGYGWPDFRNRWCTSYLKQDVIRRHLKQYDNIITAIAKVSTGTAYMSISIEFHAGVALYRVYQN